MNKAKYYIDEFKAFLKEYWKTKNIDNDYKSTNILVSSKFGFGKTTLKNEIIEDKELNNDFLVIDVNIWLNTYKHVDEIIFMELLNFFEDDKDWENIFKGWWKEFINKNKALNFLSKKLKEIKNSGYTDLINTIANKYKVNLSIENILHKVLEKKNKNKIIFLYDELDRCTPEFIRNFFNEIRHLFNNENITHIVFANENYINQFFEKSNIDDEKFIDKYFEKKYYLEKSVVEFLETLWLNIVKMDDWNLFINSNGEKSEFLLLFENNLISFREINKNMNYINKYFNYLSKNIEFFKKRKENIENIFSPNSLIYKINDEVAFDNSWIVFFLFFVCKGKSKVSINDLEEIFNIIKNKFNFLKYSLEYKEYEKYYKKLGSYSDLNRVLRENKKFVQFNNNVITFNNKVYNPDQSETFNSFIYIILFNLSIWQKMYDINSNEKYIELDNFQYVVEIINDSLKSFLK